MEEESKTYFDALLHLVLEWRRLYMQALGFNQSVKFNDIRFHVSDRLVIADLSPLAYLDLVEEIEDGSVQDAVAALYERLRPLLECQHCWRPLSAGAPREMLCLDFSLASNSYIHVCAECTGYCVKFA